ncbi:ABC1 kinase family protein [Planococcus salinus]|uniref:AarF/ABC1/UbiB kinase family protein n=1 Tax=Planococcus salinus TaxID=1848460 RepID=A0A3M8PBZ7_9BACL|nr:AarF/UbiB family protein [Planococcus salinus]RNF41142.1 AarF/ABC1/UbiB kinase family protein [Planococcus salinus]
MVYIRILLEIAVIAVFIYIISGRLMGSKINFIKRLLSVALGVTLTTFVYWYSYLRFTDYMNDPFVYMAQDESTILWIGSMLLISMLLYLFFELFDPIELGERGERITGRKFILKRIQHRWRRQKRLARVLEIAVRNGISRSLKYARNRENDRELAIAFRDTLEQSGGVFIKFGQMLSTRTELFPPVFVEELGSLQQNVKPLTSEQVKRILATSLPYGVDEVFSDFDMNPLAAGSIGQVHRAVLKENGEQVVVKLLRPDIRKIMRDDLNILVEFAEWVTSKSTWAENLGFRQLAIGFANGMREEINFTIEMRNTVQVGNALEDSEYKVKIPKVYTDYSNDQLIVLQYLEGKSISKGRSVFKQFDVTPRKFAETVLFSFFEQMLESGIFHADPHPGNIFIDATDGSPILLDFGAVGRLASSQQNGLNLFFIGVQQNDSSVIYDAVSLLVEDNQQIDRHKFEQSIGQILLKTSYVDRIPTAELIHALFDVVRDFGLSFYPSVGTALRSLISLDSTIHTIDPGFDMFTEAKVFAKKYKTSFLKKPFKEPMETKDRIEDELALLIPELFKLPKRLDMLVQRVESGKIILHHDIFSDKKNAMFVIQLFSRFVLLFTGITFGLVSAALLAIAQFIETAYAVYLNIASYTGLFLSVVLLVRLSIQAIRDMKRSNNA